MLYSEIARAYIPAPKMNYMRVVINGESWGAYINAEQFNKDFLRDYFKTDKGARWKVPGSPGGRGGMEYWGDDPAAYKRSYDIKTQGRSKVLGGSDPDVQGPERDAAREARGRTVAAPRHRRHAEIPGRGCGAGEYRRVLDPRQRLQHLPGRERTVPRHPARHERGAHQRGTARWKRTRRAAAGFRARVSAGRAAAQRRTA